MEQNNCSTKIKKWEHISEKKRYKIEGMLESGKKAKEIAQILGYSRRTIEREIARGTIELRKINKSYKKYEDEYITVKKYCADYAQRKSKEAWENKGPGLKIGKDHSFVAYIEQKIGEEHWSPEATLLSLKEGEFQTRICVKTLYNYIDRGLFLNISNKNLWNKSRKKKRHTKRVTSVALNNRNGKSIDERPKKIDERKERGHWELDLVVGSKKTKKVVVTLVERMSRKSIYMLAKDKTQESILYALKRVNKLYRDDFSEVFKTITTDNGGEFLDGNGIKEALKCEDIYYTHPYCAWEKGSNENGNRILRRFFPKGTNFSKITRLELKRIENWVNNYPRKIHKFKSANEIYFSL